MIPPLMADLLAQERQRELLDAANRHRLDRESRRPAYAPTRLVVLALVWMAEAVACTLDRIAALTRRSAEPQRDVGCIGVIMLSDRPEGVPPFLQPERLRQHQPQVDATAATTCR